MPQNFSPGWSESLFQPGKVRKMKRIARYQHGFYYRQLTIDQQYDYRRAALAITRFEPEFYCVCPDRGQIHRMLLALRYDNPEMAYWDMENTQILSGMIRPAWYYQDADQAEKVVEELRARREGLIRELSGEGDLTRQELLEHIFHYLADNVIYAEDELLQQNLHPWIYDIRGILLNEKGVCLGLAMTICYFCQALGIPSIIVTGKAQAAGWYGNHGWNLVKTGGVWRHLDVTTALGLPHAEQMKYFLVKDEELPGRSWPGKLYPGTD